MKTFIALSILVISVSIPVVRVVSEWGGLYTPAPPPDFMYDRLPPPVVFNKSNLDSTPALTTSMFRGDVQRSGQNLSSAISSDNVVLNCIESFNVGIHKASKASPAVDESGIYVGSDAGWFYALDHSCKVRWKYFATDSLRGIHSTAALDQNTVYFGTYVGDLIALDKLNGAVRWIAKVGGTIGASPALDDNFIFVAVETTVHPNGYLVKLDKRTGAAVWKTHPLGEQSHSSPSIDRQSQTVLLGVNNGMFYAFDSVSGELKWFFRTKGPIKSSPSISETNVYFTSWDKYIYALDRSTGKEKWRFKLPQRSQSSPTVFKGAVYVSAGDGAVYKFSEKDGSLVWKTVVGGEEMRQPSGTILNFASQIVLATSCFATSVCMMDLQTGKIIKNINVGGLLTGVPVAFDDSVFVALNSSGLKIIKNRKNYFSIVQESAKQIVSATAHRVGKKGRFEYNYYMRGNTVFTDNHSRYNLTRHAGVVYALSEGYAKFPSDVTRNNLQRSVDHLVSSQRNVDDDKIAIRGGEKFYRLGTASLAVVALLTAQEKAKLEIDHSSVKKILNFILSLQKGSGEFILSFPEVVADGSQRLYYPGEAIFALAKGYKHYRTPAYLEAARRGVSFLLDNYNAKKEWAMDHWLLIALYELSLIDPKILEDEKVINGIRNITKSLMSDYNEVTTNAGQISCKLEAIVPFVKTKVFTGEQRADVEAWIPSAVFKLMQYQFHGEHNKGSISDKNTGVREFRIDLNQHALSALLKFLES